LWSSAFVAAVARIAWGDRPLTRPAGAADFLVTGDENDLLRLKLHEGTNIVTVRDFLALTGRLP
jgi:hypothetical protein